MMKLKISLVAAALMAFLTSGPSRAQVSLILNEWNCVAPENYLDTVDFEGSTKSDTFFGRVRGNGGDWIELVVTTDRPDLRGWKLVWEYGTNSGSGQGVIELGDHALLASLRSGTIITITESPTAEGGLDTDLSYDPVSGDWWINICTRDGGPVTTSGSITTGGETTLLPAGEFEVNHNNWQLTIQDAAGNHVFGPVGEAALGWQGTGINAREVGKLEENPSPFITPASNYNDGTSSSFGSYNIWSSGLFSQDFSALRSVVNQPVNTTVAGAKLLGTGLVRIENVIISRSHDDQYYVQQPDRAAGIAVLGFAGLPHGYPVNVTGSLTLTSDGELAIQPASVSVAGAPVTVVPLAMGARSVGGGQVFGLQEGVAGSIGPNNVGLHALIYGKVTATGFGWMVVDDGSGRDSGHGAPGIRAAGQIDPTVQIGDFIAVEGSVSVQKIGGQLYPLLRVASPEDVRRIDQ
ncbi:MAG: hypothetical protein KatS3mg024_2566 [Armatimonadota bacterium]|nr:MAG: hypothetical protein KatS3mg024_2566 [Armatimonadota bacterium]